MLLQTTSYAGAGLVGNPSDGYRGKTIAFAIQEFAVTVTLYESPELQFLPAAEDDASFASAEALVADVRTHGYYGGIRLLKATAKVFAEYCREQGIVLPARNFTVRYSSSIPRLAGLGESSAICTAFFKALLKFYEISLPQSLVPSLCRQAERQELGVPCGLQNRVVQIYNGVVFQDYSHGNENGIGEYTAIDPARMPKLYLAFDPKRTELSSPHHRRLRVLFDEKRADIMSAMSEFADLAQQAYEAIEANQADAKLPALLDANFDLRKRVFSVSPENEQLVKLARGAGASAKFAGSGGAIIGTYEDEAMYGRLQAAMEAAGSKLFVPTIPQAAIEI
jgi:glucuronokinase